MAIKRISAKGDYRQEEGRGDATISPGMLIELMSTGYVSPHATEGGFAEAAFATEDALQGRTVSNNYSSADLVTYILPVKGAVVNALIEAGQSIAIGDKLISAGNGKLIENGQEASATTVKQIIAIAEAANDLSASGAVDTLSAVRIL